MIHVHSVVPHLASGVERVHEHHYLIGRDAQELRDRPDLHEA